MVRLQSRDIVCKELCASRMSRDQRVRHNWALVHACEVASKKGLPVAVVFNLVSIPCH